MKSWYKIAVEQLNLPFQDQVESEAPPSTLEIAEKQYLVQQEEMFKKQFQGLPKNKKTLNEAIDEKEGYDSITRSLNLYGFDWDTVILPSGFKIIVVNIGHASYVIDDFDEASVTESNTWIEELSESDLYNFVPPSEDSTFWDDVSDGSKVYHRTNEVFKESILKQGLTPQNESRGIANRDTGAAVFTSFNPEDTESYGNLLLEIDLGKMKASGYTPEASLETPVEENNTRERLASLIGTYYEPSSDLSSEGIYDSTVIFYGVIPAQYINVVE